MKTTKNKIAGLTTKPEHVTHLTLEQAVIKTGHPRSTFDYWRRKGLIKIESFGRNSQCVSIAELTRISNGNN